MNFTVQVAILAAGMVAAALVLNYKSRHVVRREALLEGAGALRSRAKTKWEKNPVAALEDENCAQVLERMAGTVRAAPTLELKEQAA